MSLYCSVDEAVGILGAVRDGNSLSAAQRLQVLANLRVATRRVNELFRSALPPFLPPFEPWQATVKLLMDSQAVNSALGTYQLDRFLLELGGTVSINGATVSVEVYPDSAWPPFRLLRLTDTSQNWYSAACDSSGAPLQLSVPGIWGFSTDYANAWLAVDALAAGITDAVAATISFTVADVNGADAYGMPVRISPGHLLKIDSQFYEVISTDTNANSVTARSGVNGTTKATHSISTPVYRWQVEDDVKRAVARQAGLTFSRQGAYTTVEVQGMSEVRYPADWLQEVMGTLQAYANG